MPNKMPLKMSSRCALLNSLSVAISMALNAHAQAPTTPAPAALPTAPTAVPSAAPTAAVAAPAPPPAAPRPYRDIIKDTKEIAGFFTLYQKDEKIWLSIKPEQFNKLFFFSYNIPQSVGERGLYGSQMGRSALVSFRRIGNQVQLIAKNTEYFAQPGTP